MATVEDFEKIDIRVGRILEAEDFPEARKPMFKLKIDFGSEVGIKHSSVQATALYTKEELVGKVMLGVVNFPPRQIGPFMSEVLCLGVPNAEGKIIFIVPDRDNAILGGKLF